MGSSRSTAAAVQAQPAPVYVVTDVGELARQVAQLLRAEQAPAAPTDAPLTLRDAAEEIGCSVGRLRRLIELKRVRIVALTGRGRGKTIQIERSEVERLIAESRR